MSIPASLSLPRNRSSIGFRLTALPPDSLCQTVTRCLPVLLHVFMCFTGITPGRQCGARIFQHLAKHQSLL